MIPDFGVEFTWLGTARMLCGRRLCYIHPSLRLEYGETGAITVAVSYKEKETILSHSLLRNR